MRLISKSILYLLFISIPILIAAGIFAYYSIYDAVEENTRELLLTDKSRAEKIIDTKSIANRFYLSNDSLSFIEPTQENKFGYKFGQSDNMFSKEEEHYRYNTLTSYYKKGNQNFKIIIWQPAIEEDDLIESLVSTIFIIICTMMLAFFTVSIFISKYTWKPFYTTLNNLKSFRLHENKIIPNIKTNTKEFKDLNKTVSQLSEKMINDFHLQKEFTENASHEMQTPLAVLKAKTETLMQSPRLNENDLQALEVIEHTINKLTSLNKSLLLLAKIENHQYSETSKININVILHKAVKNFEDYFKEKKIEVNIIEHEQVSADMNTSLTEILINNLLQNAVRHNILKGRINIELKSNGLIISNSGKNQALSENQLFMRFKHSGISSDSTGLGLSIIKSICDLYHISIQYSFKDGLHIFTLNLAKSVAF